MLDLKNINLLVSSPNNGGLLQIKNGKTYVVDRLGTTGVCYDDDGNFYRSIQHADFSEIAIYPKGGEKISIIHRDFKDIHDICFFNNFLYLVSTDTNEIIELDKQYNVTKRYKFKGEGDAWHLNCLEVINDRLCVTAFCANEENYTYKGNTLEKGFLIDVASNEILIDKLSQPHTPRYYDNKLYICDSENKSLKIFEDKKLSNEISFNGYTRGLHIDENYIYIGLSKSRNIEDKELVSKLIVLERKSLKEVGFIPVELDEIYNILPLKEMNILKNDISVLCDAKDINIVKIQKEKELVKTKESLTQSQEAIANKDKELAQTKETLTQKEQAIAQKEKELVKTKESLTQSQETIAQKEKELAKTKETLTQKEQAIAQKEKTIKQQQEEIEALKDELVLFYEDSQCMLSKAVKKIKGLVQ